MANDDLIAAYGGLHPIQQPYGQIRVNAYKLTTNATLGVAMYEPLTLDSNGRVVIYTTGGDLATCIGPALGFLSTGKGSLPTSSTSLNASAGVNANTDCWVLVADDPNQLFAIQAATDTTVSESNVGNTARMILRATRSDGLTGVSNFELYPTDLANDTGGTLQLVGLADNINSDGSVNAAGANYCKCIVRIYHHSLVGNTTSTPV